MKKASLIFLCLFFGLTTYAQTLQSPNGNLSLSFKLNDAGEPIYGLSYKSKTIVKESRMGLEIKNQPALRKGFSIIDTKTTESDETWNPVWGEVKTIRNRYKELAVTIRQTASMEPTATTVTNADVFSSANDAQAKEQKITRQIVIRFRLFDDGLGFRYEFPVQNELKYFTLTNKKTEFNLTGDHKTFWIPGDYLTIARKAKKKDEWYLGAITDENSRTANVPLDFLAPNRNYVATIYADAKDADWQNNPMAYEIKNYLVSSQTALKIALAKGGGAAASIKPAAKDDLKNLKTYSD